MKNLVLVLLLSTSFLKSQTEFSQENATNILKTLSVEIGPRPMGSEAEQQALRFAAGKFREYGCDTAYIMAFDRSSRANTKSGIAVAIKHGTAKRIIVIGGHIDSAGPEIPGADDNGSGSAVVMELARVLGKRTMQSTLVFACFGGEEQGLEGSKYFVDHFADIDSVMLMLNIDMANGLGIIDIDGDTHGRSAPPWLIRAAFEEFYNLGYENLRYPTHAFALNYTPLAGAGSDHESFLEKGIPAVDFTTDPSKPIHTPQDNFENFDPHGLKRSGDVVLKLVERFDGGVPDKQLTNYWLYVIAKTPIFVPYGVIVIFLGITLVCAAIAFILVRTRRAIPMDIHWSGIKMLLFTFILVFLGWISSDVVGLMKGYRYPWMTDVPLYYVLAGLFVLLGIWLSLIITKKLRLSQCPYIFYKRASIILFLYAGLFAWGNLELAIYPASALFLLSLAMLVRNSAVKFLLFFLSLVWMIRLIFNEWDEFFFRTIAAGGISTTSFPENLFFNGAMILFFVLYVYPCTLSFAAVYRDAKSPHRILLPFRSRWGATGIAVLIITMIAYLYPRNVYSNLWYRTVLIEETHEQSGDSSRANLTQKIHLRSAEYLDGIRISRAQGDTFLTGRITVAQIPANGNVSPSSWVHIEREERQRKRDDTTDFNITLTLSSLRRPYTVSVTYSSGAKEFRGFSSTKMFTTSRNSRTIKWYSFPDSVLILSVQFETIGNDSVKERFEIVYNTLMYPMRFERENTNFILRTKFYDSHVYKP